MMLWKKEVAFTSLGSTRFDANAFLGVTMPQALYDSCRATIREGAPSAVRTE